MLRLAWRGVINNTARYIATLVAVMTGVAFFAATGFVAERVITSLQSDVDRQYASVDAAVIQDKSSENDAFLEKLRIAEGPAEQIFGAPDVEGSAGVLTGAVAFLEDDGKATGESVGRLWIEDEELNPLELEEGNAPAAPGEIVVDRGTANDEDLAVGDSSTLLTLAGQFDVQVVGISKFGSADSIDSEGTVSLSGDDAFNWLNSGLVEYESIYLRSELDQSDLVAEIQQFVPQGFEAQTGEQFLADQRHEIGSIGRYLKQALQGFSVLALIVGGFVIYNTFNVIVTQRIRELAVLAAIGATPFQLLSSLLYEGVVVGLLGSLLGIAVGFALTFALIELLSALGVALPGSGIEVDTVTIVLGLVLGTGITVVSVLLPARRAAGIDPIEALRSAAVESTHFSRRRLIITGLCIALGAFLMLAGGNLPAIGFGAILLFFSVIFAGPILAVIGARIARPIMGFFGIEGRLAVDNTARNPQRTATTSNALLIGVFLVTFVSVAGESLKEFVVNEIKQLDSADYVIESDGGTIDEELVGDLLAIPDVEAVVPFRQESITLDGEAAGLTTGDIVAMQEVARLKVKEGSFDDLVPGTIAVAPTDPTANLVSESDSDFDAPPIGSTVTITNNAGDSLDVEVAVILQGSIDAGVTGNIVHEETFDSLVGDTAPTFAFLDVADGAETETRDAIEDRVSLRPDITLTEANEIGRLIGSVFDFLINAVNGLLGMSVVIALIGIVNTLSLSIIERRRELGLLRAIGMTDQRVGTMVRLESMVIAALGTLTGMLLGMFFALSIILAINRLGDAHVDVGFPFVTMAIVLVMGPVLGVLASLIPAWRSTKLDVLEAIEPT